MNESRRINLDYDSVDDRIDSDSVPYIETVFRPLFPAHTLTENEIAERYYSDDLSTAIRKVIKERTGKDCTVIIETDSAP